MSLTRRHFLISGASLLGACLLPSTFLRRLDRLADNSLGGNGRRIAARGTANRLFESAVPQALDHAVGAEQNQIVRLDGNFHVEKCPAGFSPASVGGVSG